MSLATADHAGNVSTPRMEGIEIVRLDEITLDPSLQCRAGVDAAVVTEYAAVLTDGKELDPGRAVRVGDELLLVDGWHRVAAHRAAGRQTMALVVREGTRRDAMLEAVAANGKNGLPRSNLDKRRAVRVLLMDPEWCTLSGHALAQLAHVTAPYVSQRRREYGVGVGEPLTIERACLIDGDPTPPWRTLLDAAPAWGVRCLEAMRVALTPDALRSARRSCHYGLDGADKAYALRQTELAVGPWPWPDKTAAQRAARAAELDSGEDLEAAVVAQDCPGRAKLYELLDELDALPKQSYGFAELIAKWEQRPRLAALARARQAEVEKQSGSDPYRQAQRVHAAKADPVRQAELVEGLSKAALSNLSPNNLALSVRDGVYRRRVGDAGPCPDPNCGGWVRKNSSCVVCLGWPSNWRANAVRSMAQTAALLGRPGYGVRVAGVVVDAAGVELLATLEAAAADGTLASADVQRELRAWASRSAPELVVEAPEEAGEAPKGDAVDEDLERDEDLADDEDLEDDEDLDDDAEGA